MSLQAKVEVYFKNVLFVPSLFRLRSVYHKGTWFYAAVVVVVVCGGGEGLEGYKQTNTQKKQLVKRCWLWPTSRKSRIASGVGEHSRSVCQLSGLWEAVEGNVFTCSRGGFFLLLSGLDFCRVVMVTPATWDVSQNPFRRHCKTEQGQRWLEISSSTVTLWTTGALEELGDTHWRHSAILGHMWLNVSAWH